LRGVSLPALLYPRQFFFIELVDGGALLNDFLLALRAMAVGSQNGDDDSYKQTKQQ
jgi:hypothetical protein